MNSLSKKLLPAVLVFMLLVVVSNTPLSAQMTRGDSLKVELAAHSESDTVRVKMLNDLMWFLRASDPSKAMQYGKEALELAQKLGFKWGMVKAYSYMGVCARNLNNYGLAAEMYLKHLLLAEELGSESEMFFAVNNIGNLYLNQEDWNNALKYALRNLPYAEEKGSLDQKAYAYTNLGRCYSGLQQYDKAMEYFDKALLYQYQRKDTARIVSILNEIANIHFLRNNDEQSIQTHQRVIRLVSQIDERTLPKTLVQMAIIYQRRKMIDSSNYYARQSAAVAFKVGRAETRATALRVLSENAASMGNFQQAYQIHIEFAAVRDSVLQLNGVKELSSLQARYEVEKKQREIETLGNESRLQQTTRNIFIAGFMIVLIFAVLIGVRYREKFRTEAIIREQNENLQVQAAEISSINELLSSTNTTLQESNEQLQSKNDELAALNAEKNELMGIVSHDLKNPIGAIHTFAELLESKEFEGEEADLAIQQIGKISDRMLDLVKNLLDVNRLESGGMTMNLVGFDIAPMVEATVYQYASQAEAKNITLHFANEAETSIATADEQAIMQVLDNIISNAVKYSPHGKNVFVRIKARNEGIRVEVQDEGQGISPEDMTKLFGKFARLSARPTGGEHSTGLGLSIVKKMVEAMNGRVWCESEVGKGATFIVELPSAQ
jgi:signal transduction histidine kinase